MPANESLKIRIVVHNGGSCPTSGSSVLACSDNDCGDDAVLSTLVFEGQQLVVQASYHVRDRDRGAWDGEGRRSQLLLSALGALNFGADIGGGFSVTKLFPREGKSADGSSADSVELRALCAKSGNHSLSVNASFGVV